VLPGACTLLPFYYFTVFLVASFVLPVAFICLLVSSDQYCFTNVSIVILATSIVLLAASIDWFDLSNNCWTILSTALWIGVYSCSKMSLNPPPTWHSILWWKGFDENFSDQGRLELKMVAGYSKSRSKIIAKFLSLSLSLNAMAWWLSPNLLSFYVSVQFM